MTREREQALNDLKFIKEIAVDSSTKKSIDIAIEALEQEPCDDCISRAKLIQKLDAWDHNVNAIPNYVWKVIREAPPVTPQPKMGKWKAFTHSAYHGNDEDGEPIWREVTVYHCNLCNRRTVIKENYCPYCGAKMWEVEE